jgi:riboflavin-specific deaminase-like protein
VSVELQRLLPEPGAVLLHELADSLELPSLAPPERPYTVTNFAVSVDGSATIAGRSGAIGTDSDTEMLMELRACVDAVMIGAGTMRVERYGPMVPSAERRERRERRGLEADPLAVIVSNRLDLPWDADLFSSGQGEVLLVTASELEPPATKTKVSVLRHAGSVDLPGAMAYLRRERGVRALLCEGGPHLHGQLVAAELVDELFVTLGPKLAGGDGPRMVDGISERVRNLELVWLLADGAELFARYRVLR